MTLLYVHALTVSDRGGRALLDGVSLHLDAGQVLGLAGGPKAGKSLLCDFLTGVRPDGLNIESGRLLLGDRDLTAEVGGHGGAIAYHRDGALAEMPRVAIFDNVADFSAHTHNAETGCMIIDTDPMALAEVCDDIAVLCAGRLVERAPANSVIRAPRHPYTENLVDGSGLEEAETSRESGCPFLPECGHAEARCGRAGPDLQMVSADHVTACIKWRELWPAA